MVLTRSRAKSAQQAPAGGDFPPASEGPCLDDLPDELVHKILRNVLDGKGDWTNEVRERMRFYFGRSGFPPFSFRPPPPSRSPSCTPFNPPLPPLLSSPLPSQPILIEFDEAAQNVYGGYAALSLVCKRWRRLLDADCLALRTPLLSAARALAQCSRPERIARWVITDRPEDPSDIGHAQLESDEYTTRWGDLDAFLSRHLLRPSLSITLKNIQAGGPQHPSLVSLLNRLAPHTKDLELDLGGIGWILEPFVGPKPSWALATAEGGLLHPSNAFLPRVRTLHCPVGVAMLPGGEAPPHPPLPADIAAAVPAFAGSLAHLSLRFPLVPPRVVGATFAGLRALRRLDLFSGAPEPLRLCGSLARLTALTLLHLLSAKTPIILEDPDDEFESPHAVASLKMAIIMLHGSAPEIPGHLARLLPALRHVTTLALQVPATFPTLGDSPAALTKLRHLSVCFLPHVEAPEEEGEQPELFGVLSSTWPCRVRTFEVLVESHAPCRLPSSFLTRLPALKSLHLTITAPSWEVEEMDRDLPSALLTCNVTSYLCPPPSSLYRLLRRCPALTLVMMAGAEGPAVAQGAGAVARMIDEGEQRARAREAGWE
jgi:hypothetical protein